MALARAGKPGLVAARPRSSSRAACQKGASGDRSPAWSQTHAATTPSGRVTRAISRIPATGSAMK